MAKQEKKRKETRKLGLKQKQKRKAVDESSNDDKEPLILQNSLMDAKKKKKDLLAKAELRRTDEEVLSDFATLADRLGVESS